MTTVPFLDLGAAYDELREELDDAALRVLHSGWFVLGPEVEAFEAEWAAYCGTDHAVGTGNGLDALTLILRAYGIGPGDEVIVPSNTYIATWLAVTAVGATVVPVEPDEATQLIDADGVEQALTDRTRAVMVVHLLGRAADCTALRTLCDDRAIKLVEDAAQAHGAEIGGRRAGALGHAAGFSFYPSKNLGAQGDAGAVTTDDPELADRVRLLRNYGSRTKYHHELAGVNSRLDPLQAALLRVKLRHLDAWNARRRALAARYGQALAGVPRVRLPEPDGSAHVWHVYAIRTAERNELARRLADAGIQTLVHYPVPPHRSGPYAHLGLSLPVADRLADESLSLPIGPQLSAAQVDVVAATIRAERGALAVAA
jgi:dTDP-4-amino-4,6-dideoxygalactose transaminase